MARTPAPRKKKSGKPISRPHKKKRVAGRSTPAPKASKTSPETERVQLKAQIADYKQLIRELQDSEARYRALIEHGASVYTVIDAEGKVIYQSSSAQREYGWRSEEVIGKSVMDLIHPEDAEKAANDIAEITEQPHLVKTRGYRLLHKDGTYCNVQVTGANLKSNRGVGGILLTSHDVTAQKWAEEALRQVKGSFAAFINDSSFGYVEVDLDGNLTFANRRAAEIPGRSIEELLKMNFKDVVAAEDHERAAQKIGTMPQATPSGPEEYMIQGKDGRTHFVEVTTLPIVKAGKPFGLQLTFAEITERKLAQEALAQSEARFRELADLLPEIVYEMSDKGILTYVNKCAFAITGYTQEDLDSQFEGPTIFVPEDRKRARENMVRIMLGEADEVRRYTIQRKDGSTFPALARSAPIIRNGKPVGLRGIIFKVDE